MKQYYLMIIVKEMTVEVGPGKEECFFESVKQGFTLGVEYQVILV